MNRRTTTSSIREEESSQSTSATDDEIIVAQILLDLKNLISSSESLANFNWGCKRRRSCLDDSPPLRSTTSQPSTSIQRTGNEFERRRRHIKADEVVVVENHDRAAHTAVSPDTPFSFTRSDESDEKSKISSMKTSKKSTREKYLVMIKGLTRSKDLLTGVLNSSLRKEEPRMEISVGVNLGIELTHNDRVNSMPHQQPFTADPTAEDFQCLMGPIMDHPYPSNNGPALVNHVSPLGFDLNVPAEETLGFGVELSPAVGCGQSVSDKRARLAEARRKRRGV